MRRPYRSGLLLLLAFLAACGGPGTPRPPGPGTINFDAADRTPESCGGGAGLSALGFGDWAASMPARPEDAVVILDPGHGGLDGGACIASAPGNGGCNNVACASELNAAGLGSLTEAQLTLATALRLKAVLERMGFKVGLTRTGTYGGRGLSVSGTISGDDNSYKGSLTELQLRGWLCSTALGRSSCPWPLLRGKSRVHQILDSFGFSLGDSGVADARVTYISIHYDSASVSNTIGPLIFASKVRDPGDRLSANPALGGAGPVDFRGNYVRHLFDYLIASVRQSQRLEQYKRADLVVYEDGFYPGEAGFTYKDGPLQGSGLHAKVKRRAGNFGTVSVASGFEGVTRRPRSYIVSIPQNLTFEVANIRDCANVPTLARSIKRGQDGTFDADSALPDPTDPLDVAAEDIAHGLVEYYESYVPGFKAKVCENLKNSDWGQQDWRPDWCKAPDINAVTPDRFEAELRVGEETQATLSFENVGDGDLVYTVSTSSPVADLGPPEVVPAGHVRPLDASQGGVLPPGKRAELPVTLRCTSSGTQTGSVRIESNDPDEPEVEVPISLTCQPAPVLRVRELGAGVTAFNFLLPAESGWAPVANDVLDFWEAGGEAELHYRLTLPDWLELSPTEGVLPPGGHFLDQVAPDARADCGPAGEREGVVVIESDDPQNPRVEVPVRLLCAVLEVRFEPATYNPLGEPPEARCPPLSGTITVRGAPHLKELYAGPQGYGLPAFTYLVEHPNYTTRRWPILHAPGDPDRPWNWSYYPEIPFTSFVLSCSFAKGDHQVNTFDLVHPRWSPNPPNPRSAYGAHLVSPTGFTIADNRFPGVVYDYARRCDDEENCTEYDVEVALSSAGASDQTIALTYDQWDWLLMPLAETFTEDVQVLDQGNPVQSGHYVLGPIFSPDQLRYCRILRTNRLRDHNGGYLYPPGMPPVFWGQTVELVGPDLGLVQAMHEPLCYDPWDPGAGPYPPWSRQRPQALELPAPRTAGFKLLPVR